MGALNGAFLYFDNSRSLTSFEVLDRHTGDLKQITDPREYLTKDYLEEFYVDENDDAAEGKDNRDIALDEKNDNAQKLSN